MSDKMDNLKNTASPEVDTAAEKEEEYSLNDDRRVKVLSPGAMVAKRFFRNRTAVMGMIILICMFLFSFVGGMITPYGEAEQFYRTEIQSKEYAGVTKNNDYRFVVADGAEFNSVAQAQMMVAIQTGKTEFAYKDTKYTLVQEGTEFYSAVPMNGTAISCLAYKDIVTASSSAAKPSFDVTYQALKLYTNGQSGDFTSDGAAYTVDADGNVTTGGTELAYISRYVVQAIMPDIFLERDFKDQLTDTIDAGGEEFSYTGEDGVLQEYTIEYDATSKVWAVKQGTDTLVYDSYSPPSAEHLLGTDKNGMDMLTRLMYGGRVSLVIGFIVVVIETVLGVIMGGLAGYFGGWVDNLIMRIVDVFYCIPSTPILIILGAAMDAMRLDSTVRMLYMMLLLGFLGWPGVARMVRGQILSLREQEFMTATEACGIRVSRRIFRHLIPNVIPQLIVRCTMGLGSTIITEATLSFLGLGVKFPFASWGNIINDVNNTFVLTNYWFIWIPAGFCLMLTVLAFNLVGDGLRDAFDPKMKR